MKPDLIILHGALGAKTQFKELANALDKEFTVHLFNFEGHGGRSTIHPYTIDLFTQNLIDYIVSKELFEPYVFGYSMGGYVALNAAWSGVTMKGLMTLGTKFGWNQESAANEIKLLNPEKIVEKVPQFAAFQDRIHAPDDWKEVMRKTADMMIGLGNDPVLTDQRLNEIELNTLCCVGDSDKMVSLEETKHTAAQLQNGQTFIFENTEHPIEKVNTQQLADKIIDFCREL